jgi:hypothetical protein
VRIILKVVCTERETDKGALYRRYVSHLHQVPHKYNAQDIHFQFDPLIKSTRMCLMPNTYNNS